MRYRPEIDGLRAVAVIPVILFHAGFAPFRGGFVGVDVFFVISGYLITGIILADLAAGSFSLVSFYERRARRVLPALFLVLAVATPAAWMVLTPHALKAYAASLKAVASFSSNFYFLRQSGYFDTPAELKPLLHTWSLAVEEQYYVLFPLLLIAMWRFFRHRLAALLALLCLASAAAGVWLARSQPSAAFYLLPTRAWEILVGALAAIHLHRHPARSAVDTRGQALAWVGLAAIAFAVWFCDANTAFPGPYSLLPTIGAVLIILYARPEAGAGRVLSLRPLVGVGLVSYSAYLWHQPFFSLVEFASPREPAPAVMGALAAVTLLLAYLSWRFVEGPFRRKGLISRRAIFRLAAAATTATILLAGEWRHAIRLPTEVIVGTTRIPIPVTFAGIMRDGRDCSFPGFDPSTVCAIPGTRTRSAQVLVVIGDSHARVLTQAVAERTEMFSRFVDLSASGCPFLLGLSVYINGDAHRCTEEYQHQRLAFLQGLRREDLVLVVAARWPIYLDGKGFDNTVGGVERTQRILATDDPTKGETARVAGFYHALGETIAAASAAARTVILVLPNQANGWDPIERAQRLAPRMDTSRELFDALRIPLGPVEAWARPVDEFVRAVAARYPNVVLVDPLPLTCGRVPGECDGGSDGEFYFSDEGHLSLRMNRMVTAEIAKLLGAVADSKP